MSDWVVGLTVGHVSVGGQRQQIEGSTLILDGLVGCVKNVRVGSSANARLHDPQEYNVEPGCQAQNTCKTNSCPPHSYCTDLWGEHKCTCQPGQLRRRV